MCESHLDPGENTDRPADVGSFANELVVGLTNVRIYSPDHPRVCASIEALGRSLEAQFAHLERDTLELGAVDGCLVFDERPLLTTGPSAPRLLSALLRVGAGGLSFTRGAGADDFLALARILANEKSDVHDHTTANRELVRAGCGTIKLLPGYCVWEGTEGTSTDLTSSQPGSPQTGEAEADEHVLAIPRQLHREIFDHLADVMTDVLQGRPLHIGETRTHVEAILRQLNEDAASVLDVSHYASPETDSFQFRHSTRVACLALALTQHLTRDEDLLRRIGTAALLHDVGKAWVPFEILHCKGRLEGDALQEMRKHAEYGAQILLDLGVEDPLLVATALYHHRTLDHGGYPEVPHEVELSRVVRIVTICDVYEALTAERDYKTAMAPRWAYCVMMQMEGHFDRSLLHRFIQVNGIYPAGSWARLDSGAVGRVESQTDDLTRPVIQIDGRMVEHAGERRYEHVDPYRWAPCEDAGARDERVVAWLGYDLPATT